MSTRRGHRKSRYGCATCKRRHIKCDETKPICGNCSITGRDCSFLSTAGIDASLGISTTTARIESSSSSPAQSCNSLSAASNLEASQSSPQPQCGEISEADGIETPPANLAQLELLHHFTHGSLQFPVAPMGTHDVTPLKIIEEALDCEYLMNEILAFSARYLATLRPDRSVFYLNQARQFQTHALACFNRKQVHTMQEEHLRIIFFSWMLGIHLLCDVAPLGQQQGTLERFFYYLQLHRGVRAATMDAWESLLESEYRGMFHGGAALANRRRGGGCTSSLRLLIQDSLGLNDSERESSLDALARLQWVFSVYEDTSLEATLPECFLTAFSWPQIMDAEFEGLLYKRNPEALLVLAHFAVVLHWCRRHWIFSQVGCYLLNSIASELGQGWGTWLQWPTQMINNDN
ncbi:uncharacterized protein NECHADRAFT_82849 [Fusarium vanettenii 77-13-4]|uniref:Zn(2)-C6 fungal-type domain-containing protein n=1 Tax=Fusarium vanettenii (strain ATCC MYA-4622 / CBS 123669 / FGSC 9596 / NRRL 45880 / 77-13-4) TaxID=660122 RepID=C7YX06_FUSV7|nr:uncharacterized protein NECHADRAFT_82849 [Fusarium vanettenii 77-13-4]EEU43745.1 hypothetical protein NECHADRAFT_82849 [Fusarium vanettenii 77-13-4]